MLAGKVRMPRVMQRLIGCLASLVGAWGKTAFHDVRGGQLARCYRSQVPRGRHRAAALWRALPTGASALGLRTCVRKPMTAEGGPYTIFRRALERRSLVGVRSAVANLPAPPRLDDALVICLLLLDEEPDRYQRGAVRWIGRLLLEQPGVGLRHAELAAAYLAALPDPARREAATEALGELGRAVGLPRLGARITAAG
jgi:hypothetical protein